MRLLAVASATWRRPRAARTFTLRELLKALESARNRAILAPPHLSRLLSLVSDDFALAVRHPERRGGPDTVRSLGAWRSRYNHLDRYLRRHAG